jgi:concentrative nucleoside transporter, CNT family
METYNLVSLGGLFALLGFAWLLSPNKKAVNGRVVFWGLALQACFAFFIFILPAGSKIFLIVNDLVIRVLDSASAGTRFVFGRLALPPGTTDANGVESLGYFFAFQGVPTIIFFSALMGLLYFFRIMPKIIRGFAAVFSRLMGVSGAESLAASSEIFLGIESSFAVRPYIERMTDSELTTILTAGMATVASNILAVYVIMLRPVFPAIAGHLVSASLLAAPSALIMSKLLMPETGRPETLGLRVTPDVPRESNVIEAILNAANAGVKLIVGICALLLAFLGLVALTDLILNAAGGWINGLAGIRFDWSLKGLLGIVFYPFTLQALQVPEGPAGHRLLSVHPADRHSDSGRRGRRTADRGTQRGHRSHGLPGPRGIDAAGSSGSPEVRCHLHLCPVRLRPCRVPGCFRGRHFGAGALAPGRSGPPRTPRPSGRHARLPDDRGARRRLLQSGHGGAAITACFPRRETASQPSGGASCRESLSWNCRAIFTRIWKSLSRVF